MTIDRTIEAKRPSGAAAPRRSTGDFVELALGVVSILEAADEPPQLLWRFDLRIAAGVCSWLGSSGEIRCSLDRQQQQRLDVLAHAALALPTGSSGGRAGAQQHAITTVRVLGWTREPPRPTPLCSSWSIDDVDGSGRETGPGQLRALLEHVAASFGAALPAPEHTRLEQTIALLRVPEPAPGYDGGEAIAAPDAAVAIPFELGVSVRLGQQPGPSGLFRLRRDAEAQQLRVIRAADQTVLACLSLGERVELPGMFALDWSGANSLRLAPRSSEPLYIQRLRG